MSKLVRLLQTVIKTLINSLNRHSIVHDQLSELSYIRLQKWVFFNVLFLSLLKLYRSNLIVTNGSLNISIYFDWSIFEASVCYLLLEEFKCFLLLL